MPSPILNLLHRHLKTFSSFGAMQAMQMLTPLLALPWLARILGAEAFGKLLYMCLFPPLVALFMDWGLSVGGTREAARHRDNISEQGILLGKFFSAKIILTIILCIISLFFYFLLPAENSNLGAFIMAIGAGVARSLNPIWFFQGIGKGVPLAAVADIMASANALLLTFLFIRSSSAWPLYLLFLMASKTVAAFYLLRKLWREYKPYLNFINGMKLLASTSPFFGSSFAIMVIYNGTQLILGYVLTDAAIGILGACNKILRAVASLINPFAQTIFPEICRQARVNPLASRKTVWISLITALPLACLCALILSGLAPFIISVALGKEYAQAAPVLQIMFAALPFMACNNILATQIMAPHEQEKRQFRLTSVCAIISLPLAAGMGSIMGIDGGAWLPVLLEGAISCGYFWLIWKYCPYALFSNHNW